MSPVKHFLIFIILVTVVFICGALQKEKLYEKNIKRKTEMPEGKNRLTVENSQRESKKIIISVNKGGPNNQMWGLREGLFISHLLGREFVPPLFFKHFTTEGNFSMKPDVFINLNNLSSLESLFL